MHDDCVSLSSNKNNSTTSINTNPATVQHEEHEQGKNEDSVQHEDDEQKKINL